MSTRRIQENILPAHLPEDLRREWQRWCHGENEGAAILIVDGLASRPEVLNSLPAPLLGQLVQNAGIGECAHLLAQLSQERLVSVADAVLWSREGGCDRPDPEQTCDWLLSLEDLDARDQAKLTQSLGEDYLAAILAALARVQDARTAAEAQLDHDRYALRHIPFENLFAGYAVTLLPQRPECGENLIALLSTLEEHAPEFLEATLARCAQTAFDDDGQTATRVSEQLEGDLAEERTARRRADGFLTAEDAAQALREIRIGDTAQRAHLLLSRFRRIPPPRLRPFDWMENPLAPVATETHLFAAKVAALAESNPLVEGAFREDTALLANVLVEAGHLGTSRIEPNQALDAVAALCELGAAEIGLLGCEFVFAAFQAGWRKAREEM